MYETELDIVTLAVPVIAPEVADTYPVDPIAGPAKNRPAIEMEPTFVFHVKVRPEIALL